MIVASLTVDFGFQIDSYRNVTFSVFNPFLAINFSYLPKKYFLYRLFRSETVAVISHSIGDWEISRMALFSYHSSQQFLVVQSKS